MFQGLKQLSTGLKQLSTGLKHKSTGLKHNFIRTVRFFFNYSFTNLGTTKKISIFAPK